MNCKRCESANTIKAGIEVRVTGKYQRIKCQDCGHVMKGARIVNVG
jgi:transposase-like protein